jgi:uncharacterized membrane protein YbhN (UPF0104 family)
MGKTAWKFLKPLLTLFIVWAIFKDADFYGMWQGLRQSNPLFFFLAFLLMNIGVQTVTVQRWQFLLSQNGMDLPFSSLIRFHYIGILFQVFLPSSLGGDMAKFVLIQKKGKGAESVNSLLIARFVGVYALLVLAVPGIFLYPVPDAGIIRWILFTLLAGGVLVLFLLRSNLIDPDRFMKISWLVNPLKLFKNLRSNFKGKILFPVFVQSLLLQVLSSVVFYLLFVTLGVQVDFWKAFFLSPLISAIAMVIPSFLGIGPREMGLFYFFQVEIGSKEMLGSLSLLINALILSQVLIGAFFWLTNRNKNRSSAEPG